MVRGRAREAITAGPRHSQSLRLSNCDSRTFSSRNTGPEKKTVNGGAWECGGKAMELEQHYYGDRNI